MKQSRVFLDLDDDSSRVLPDPVFKPGDLCGAYEIERLIARGGSADVYRARHLFLGIARAIKIMRQSHADQASLRRRFVREARSLVVIDHPNIVKVVDGGEQDGRAWIGMELVDGEPLRNFIHPGTPMRVIVALRRFIQICEGVAAAHDRRLIHRDLKPENIIVGNERVKILDFGIGKQLGVPNGMKTTRRVLGTPAYASPEHLLSVMDEQPVDERTDVYSLAHIAYEMFLGRHAFAKKDGQFPPKTELIRAHIEPKFGRIVPLPKLLPDFPEYVWKDLERALRRDPNERHRNARELLAGMVAGYEQYGEERLSRDEFYEELQSSSMPVAESRGDRDPDVVASPARAPNSISPARSDAGKTGALRSPAYVNDRRPLRPSSSRVERMPAQTVRRKEPSIGRLAALAGCGVVLSFAVVGVLQFLKAAQAAPQPQAVVNPNPPLQVPVDSRAVARETTEATPRQTQKTEDSAVQPVQSQHVMRTPEARAPIPVASPDRAITRPEIRKATTASSAADSRREQPQQQVRPLRSSNHTFNDDESLY